MRQNYNPFKFACLNRCSSPCSRGYMYIHVFHCFYEILERINTFIYMFARCFSED